MPIIIYGAYKPEDNPGKHKKDNPGRGCKSERKHTPITSEKQQGLFGAELARRKRGEKGRMPGITTEELRKHLKESKGKELPKKAKKR